MKGDRIRYTDSTSYKYRLAAPYAVETGILLAEPIASGELSMAVDGRLSIAAGYPWDGPSFPAIDTLNFMRGSLVHDALYELMRRQLLDPKIARPMADALLVTICREDGMSAIRCGWVGWGVRTFARRATKPYGPEPDEVILTAP